MATRGRVPGDENTHAGSRATASTPEPARSRAALTLASRVGNRSFAQLVTRRRTLSRQWLELGLGLWGVYKALEDSHDDATTPPASPLRDIQEEHVPRHDDVVERTGGYRLWAAVGRDAPNYPHDVEIVRNRLAALGYPSDAPNEPDLAGAITAYQTETLHFKHPDGRVDPGGGTLAALYAGKTSRGLPDPRPDPKPDPDPPPRPPVKPIDTGPLIPGDCVWVWENAPPGKKKAVQGQLEGAQFYWFNTTKKDEYHDHGFEIYEYVVHTGEIRRGQPHMNIAKHPDKYHGTTAWLNNNPGNLTWKEGAPSFGAYKDKQGKPQFNWHHFLIFPSREVGLQAIIDWFKQPRYAKQTISGAMNLYAPRDDPGNKPDVYAADIVKGIHKLGGPEDLAVSTETIMGTLNDNQMKSVRNVIGDTEGTNKGDTYYSRDDPKLQAPMRELMAS